MAKGISLKKFLKYFDDMNELLIYDWNKRNEIDVMKLTKNSVYKDLVAEHCLLFKGYTFDKGAKKKLKALYKAGYELERNEDGCAVMLFPYVNEHNANMCVVQINVRKPE